LAVFISLTFNVRQLCNHHLISRELTYSAILQYADRQTEKSKLSAECCSKTCS